MNVARCIPSLPLLVLLALPSAAQEFRGSITGRIVDPSGGVIAGAQVTCIQADTGSRHQTVSTSEGQYTLPFLTPGVYSLSVEAQGFKKLRRDGLRVASNDRVGLDLSLEVGGLTETVTVTTDAPLLQTATASTGQVISSRQIENMPLNGRTPILLAQLAFGVTPTSNPQLTRPFDNNQPSNFSIGGAPSRTNELLVDGAPNANSRSQVAYNPPVDSVQEVKVETFQADAAYGHTGGGTVNIVLKGGTNNFHGNVYWFNQMSNFAATPFFTNRAGQEKQYSRYNQFGANAGGPLVLPKLIDGRNKAFFYFAQEGVRDAIPRPVVSTVPTAQERRGDFSQLLALGGSYTVYDPRTGVREGTRVRRQPFAGNIIPTSRLDPIAQKYLSNWYPEPNQPGRADGADNFLAGSSGERNYFSNYIGRMDFNLSDRHKFFFNYRTNERTSDGGNPLGGSLTAVNATNGLRRTNYGSQIDDVYTISPTMILNTRLNWTRFTEASMLFSEGFDMTSLGFPASLAAASPKAVLPRIVFERFAGVGDSAGYDNPYDVFQLFTSLTKIVNSHTLKFGADLRLQRESYFLYGYSSGTYSFGSGWTRGPLDNSPVSPLGQDMAGFLLGLPVAGTFDLNNPRTNQALYYSFFIQDDWRVSNNLTLNLGLRYERDTPTTERFDRSTRGFDTTTASPISAQAKAAYARNPIPELPVSQFAVNGGILFAGPGQRNVYSTSWNNFSPRFGFAWKPGVLGSGTVLRGGMGLFFAPIGTTGVQQPGFSQPTTLVPTLDGYLTPSATFANPFPSGIEPPTGSSLGLATFLGKNHTFFNPVTRNSYAIRWHLGVQREIGKNMVAELGYLGNHALYMPIDRQLNYVPAQYLSTSSSRDQAVINQMTSSVANPLQNLAPGTGLNGSVVARNQLLRPFPQFTGVVQQSGNEGSSYFHQLMARFERRFSSGLQLLMNYSYSRLIEHRSRLNEPDFALEKRVASEDRPHRLSFSGSYDLPFGRGKAIAAGDNPVVQGLVGGWILNGIFSYQTGAPLDWGNLIYLGGDLASDPRNIDRAFDTTRFNRVAAQQLDWNLRTFPSRFSNARVDGVNTIDVSMIKNTRLHEHLNMQLRFEAFNLLNRPQFGGPNVAATSSAFSTITSQANLPRRIQMALRLSW